MQNMLMKDNSMLRIRIILIQIGIQDLKKIHTDPDPDRTVIQIRMLAKTIRVQIRMQAKKDSVPVPEKILQI